MPLINLINHFLNFYFAIFCIIIWLVFCLLISIIHAHPLLISFLISFVRYFHNLVSKSPTGTSDPRILKPLCLKGTILIQPFFGGETRTESERQAVQPPGSALTLPSSDTYWRLSLPVGANRDHHWCNPLAKGATKVEVYGLPPMMVCISEMDILKDRNLEFCAAMASAGKRVEKVIYRGVGHAFHILQNSQLSQLRKHEMMSHLKAFINH